LQIKWDFKKNFFARKLIVSKDLQVQEVINSLNSKKSSGYDLVTGKILKELSITGIKYLTLLFNAVLLKGYFPAQWKVPQIILILKPGNLTS
jgi:hypothetical protein